MPSDEVNETLSALRDGDMSDILDEDEDYSPTEAMDMFREQLRNSGAPKAFEAPYGRPAIPQDILDVLDSSAKEELVGVARMLNPKNRKKLTLVFHTPIGEVRSAVDWVSNKPSDLMRGSDQLMLVKVRTSESTFSPTPGAELEISFEEYQGRAKVICLAPPQTIYPGVDLLCFLPQNLAVDKNGRLKEGAPSVVSGAPSNGVDDAGEPIAEGEKSANMKELPPGSFPPAPRGRADDLMVDEHMDFDKTREG